MDVLEAIKSRRAVRAWTDEDITTEILTQILEAGRWSPSPLNSQPWHLIVIGKKETLVALAKEAREASFLHNAKLCIVVCAEKKVIPPDQAQNAERVELINWLAVHDQYEYAAVCALENMWLLAWSLGIGGCWVTVDKSTSYKLLEIPEDKAIIGGLALGHVRGTPVVHRENDRKPAAEMVFWEKYGATRRTV